MNNIYILAIIKFSNRPEDLEENLHKLVKASQAEAGNISYSLYQDENEPYKFVFQEVWENKTAFDIHKQSTHFTHFIDYINMNAESVEISQLKNLY